MISNPIIEWINKKLVSILLIIILSSSILGIQFILLPRNIISYDFALYLLAELTGLIVTVFIVDYVISWNNTRIWLRVEKSVKQLLGQELHQIILDTHNYLDNNPIDNGKKTEKIFLEKIQFVVEQDQKLNTRLATMINNNRYTDLFERRKSYLDMIELKYNKFFDPDILNTLIELERHLHSINIKIRSRQSRIQNNWSSGISEKDFEESVLRSIININKKILTLNELGIAIYYN